MLASAGLFISMARSKPSFRNETVLTLYSTFTREGEAQLARVLGRAAASWAMDR
jgi:hypothetical protein